MRVIRLSSEDIKCRLAYLGHQYISDEFKFAGQKEHRFVTYTCRCGSIATTKLSTVSQGFGCKSCYKYNQKEALTQYSFSYVETELELLGAQLIEFTGTGNKLVYLCNCGQIATIKSVNCKLLYRCDSCIYCRKPKNFISDTHTPEVRKERTSKEYVKWRLNCLETYGYECIKCTADTNLHVHHIESFSKNKDLRLNPTNGVILCKTCHGIFHAKYGFKNTRDQLVSWLEVDKHGY